MRLDTCGIRDAYDAALAAVEPRAGVAGSMSFDGSVLTVGPHVFDDLTASDVVVVALGKAAAAMATGAHDVVGGSRGIVVTTRPSVSPFPACVGSHPIPDESSRACGEALLRFVESTRSSDVVLFLISGGGSAVATLPIEAVTMDEIAKMNALLIASGIPIEDINEVRASVSQIKGGRLATATNAERQATLILSDVVGSGPEHVASGPTTGFELGLAAGAVLERAGLQSAMPATVVAAADGFRSRESPTPPLYAVIGSPSIAAAAAAENLKSQGFVTSVDTTVLTGEAREEAVALVDRTNPGTVTVAAGETTVTVRGQGVGGRNQEAALAAALHIDGDDVLFAALGTDGVDGPTTAAGAIVDGGSVSRATRSGIDLKAALVTNDSHSALTALDETVIIGSTGTNVADLWIVARGPF